MKSVVKKTSIACLLITAMVFSLTACDLPFGKTSTTTVPTTTITTAPTELSVPTLGIGSQTFTVTVTDKDGKDSLFEIHTDEVTVGSALLNLQLIDGEQGQYGLYVKTVNGITLNYETDGLYWAFYINGTYATTGVDTTPVTEGASYQFKAQKG